MTRYRWDRELHRILSGILEQHGFAKVKALCFARKMPHCIQILNFGGSVRGGTFKFSCMVGIRIPEIESLLRPDTNTESFPTVVTPFHFLYDDRRFFEWEANTPDDLQSVANSAAQEILAVTTPFFEQFPDLDSVERELKRTDGFPTFPVTFFQRAGILAAAALCRGCPDEAKEILSDAMSEAANKDQGRRSRIEEIYQQLFPA